MAFMYPHMSRWWPITNMAPSHHLNWCGIFIRKTFRHYPGRAVSQYKLHSIITNWLTWLNYTFNIDSTCQGPISYKEAYEYKMAPPQYGQFILLNPLNRHPLGKPWWHDTGHPLWVQTWFTFRFSDLHIIYNVMFYWAMPSQHLSVFNFTIQNNVIWSNNIWLANVLHSHIIVAETDR